MILVGTQKHKDYPSIPIRAEFTSYVFLIFCGFCAFPHFPHFLRLPRMSYRGFRH